MSGTNRRVKTLPSLQTTTQIKRIGGGWEEVTIASHHDTTATGTICECGHDEIEGCEIRHNIIVAILGLAKQVPIDMKIIHNNYSKQNLLG